MTRLAPALLLCCAACVSQPAAADQKADPPAGAIPFCMHNRSLCTPQVPTSAPASAMDAIAAVNRRVNQGISGVVFPTAEAKREENQNWRTVVPGGAGGCAEFAWTKFLLLAWEGIPLGAMRAAVVDDGYHQANIDHIVLLVRVGGQVVVLDNMTPTPWPADQANHNYLAVQDDQDRFNWTKPDGVPK